MVIVVPVACARAPRKPVAVERSGVFEHDHTCSREQSLLKSVPYYVVARC